MKKLLSIFLTAFILFSLSVFSGIYVSAESQAFTITNLSPYSEFCTLTFNKEIDEDIATENIKVYMEEDNSEVTGTVSLSEDKMTATVKFDKPIDITKSYIIKADILSDSAFEEIITNYSQEFSFDVVYNENFDSYEAIADIDSAGYGLRLNNGTIKSTLSQANEATAGTEKPFILVDDGNGGKRLGMKNYNSAYFTNASKKIKHWYTIELTIDPNGEKPQFNIIRDPYFFNYNPYYYTLQFTNTNWKYTYISCFSKDGSTYEIYGQDAGAQGTANIEIVAPSEEFSMIYDTRIKNTLSIYYDGILKKTFSGLSYKVHSQQSTDPTWGTGDDCYEKFGIRSTTTSRYQYIDNLRVYRALLDTPVFTPVALPEFSKVDISGTTEVGGTLTCNVDDITNSPGIEYTYKWYSAESSDALFPDEWTLLDGTASSHTITSDDRTKYITCEATQNISYASGSLPMKKIRSNSIYGETKAPEAQNVGLTEVLTDETLTAIKLNYDYFDPNIISSENDPNLENGTVILWEKSLDGNIWTDTEVTTKEYPISSNDTDYFLRCTVTVKNDAEKGDEAVPVTTDVYTLPFAPVAIVGLTQTATTIGSSLVAKCEYYDENGDPEINTQYGWYRCTSVSDTGTLVGNSLAYGIKSDDCGYYLIFRATPSNGSFPKQGKTASTDAVLIPAVVTYPSGSGSGNSSGGSYSSYKNEVEYVKKDEVPEETVTENENKETQETQKEIYSDIKNHWAKNEITKLSEMGIVKGMEGGFYPEQTVTRAQWATMLARAAKLELNKENKNVFSDVSEDAWYKDAVLAMYESGLMVGDGKKFRPDESISREEMAKSICDLYEYLNKTPKNNTFDISQFEDSEEISEWAKAYIEKACSIGLLKGDEKGDFNAKGKATRAEASVVIIRVLEAE